MGIKSSSVKPSIKKDTKLSIIHSQNKKLELKDIVIEDLDEINNIQKGNP